MTPIAFTICSNNYFSRALAWADSMRKTNPEYTVVIGLADGRSSEVDYSTREHKLISVDEILIPNIDWMMSHYDIVEFNTAVKPYYFDYFFKTFDPPHVLYFDPDIYMYSSLSSITKLFDNGDLLLTPHVNHPYSKTNFPWENHFLKFGLYNLGFAGMKKSKNADEAISWWKERTAEHCLCNLSEGYFVDQLWTNYFPIFFEKVALVRHPGANVAYWNIHERFITRNGNEWKVNGETLLFFHFSSFDPNRPNLVTKEGYSNYDFTKIPNILDLTEPYADALKKNHFDVYRNVPYTLSLGAPPPEAHVETIATRIRKKERILKALSLRLVGRESLIDFVASLLKDYAEYHSIRSGLKSESVYRIDEIRKQNRNLQRGGGGGILTRMRTIASSVKSFIR